MAASLAKSTEHTPILLKFLLLIILLSYVTKSYPSAHHNKTTLIGTGLKVFPPRNFSFGSTMNISLKEKPNTSRQQLPDVEEYVQLKRTVKSQLSLSEAEECYRLWGHISCNTYFGHRYVDKILAEQLPSLDTSSLDSVRNTLAAEGKNSDIVEVSFQPLAAFFRHLHKSDRPGTSERGSPLDFQALEEVALQHTHHETTYDMGTVNF